MHPDERLSRLIGDIYDAALDAPLWTEIVGKIAGFVGGQAAGLLSKDAVSNVGNAHYHFGVDPHYIELYRETYWRFDPMAPLLFFPIGEVACSTDVVPDEELYEGRFYREWLKPQGWVDAANVVLDKSLTSCAILSVVRKGACGRVDEEMRRRMQLIVPHTRRAVLIGKVIDLKATEAATFAEAIDGLSAGMFLTDESGRIVHANAAGQAILADADFLYAAGGRLVARNPQTNHTLREVVSATQGGDAAVGVDGIGVPFVARDGGSHVAHVLPLTSGARRGTGRAHSATAAIFVHKAALDTTSPPETIAWQFRLTPSELRVLLGIVEVGGVPEVAEALGVADTTVKTHLGNLYEKTGTRRQADLVKLFAGFASPLVN